MADYFTKHPATVECFGQSFFFLFGQKKGLIMLFWPILGHCWCSVVSLIAFSSKKNKIKNIYINPKISLKKMQQIHKRIQITNKKSKKNIFLNLKILNFFVGTKKCYSLSFAD